MCVILVCSVSIKIKVSRAFESMSKNRFTAEEHHLSPCQQEIGRINEYSRQNYKQKKQQHTDKQFQLIMALDERFLKGT